MKNEYELNTTTVLPFAVLLGLFTASYVMAPILANKVIQIGPIIATAGTISYSLTF
jgi:hypothetical protein